MSDRRLTLKRLRQILSRYGAWEDSSRGKGSHTMFFRQLAGGVVSYPIPTHKPEVDQVYVRGIRRRFELTPEHGVSDEEFYGG